MFKCPYCWDIVSIVSLYLYLQSIQYIYSTTGAREVVQSLQQMLISCSGGRPASNPIFVLVVVTVCRSRLALDTLPLFVCRGIVCPSTGESCLQVV